jgi:uncharacterized protein YciI
MKLKFIFTCLAFSIICLNSVAQNYDKALADSLGADDYGMKKYVLVILKTGTNEKATKAETDSLFRGHMENITRLVNSGKLIVSGPFQKNDNKFRGIFILNVQSIDEARLMLETDPAIKQNLFAADFYVWCGSAALPTYLPFHEKIEKNSH